MLQAAGEWLAGNFDELEARQFVVSSLACTNRNPKACPAIEDVLSIFLTASDPPPPQEWR